MSIKGKQTVVTELGYWPEFCDAKIDELSFRPYTESGAVLLILLHYIDTDKRKDLNVRINLLGVHDMNFGEFREENVIDKVILENSNSNGVDFEIEACAGIFGSCKSRSAYIELISSKPFK